MSAVSNAQTVWRDEKSWWLRGGEEESEYSRVDDFLERVTVRVPVSKLSWLVEAQLELAGPPPVGSFVQVQPNEGWNGKGEGKTYNSIKSRVKSSGQCLRTPRQ